MFGVAQSRQLGLFGNEPPSIDASFAGLERTALSDDAWFEYAPGWLAGHESVFTLLGQTVHWRREKRTMYEHIVDVPRLVASLPDDGPVPPIVAEAQAAISTRYGESFTRVSLGYYRNGQESVAWHGDYVARNLPSALVATISVGAPRRFLLRPKGGGRSLSLRLGWGDLLVMGGSCQRTFEHSIPKVASASPRIAVMLRPVWESPAGD
jgi:alkylated DNA repair dioxygenase AlkB